MSKRIDAFSRRVEADAFFLASALDEYARSEQLDEGELASALRCSPDAMAPLRLCRRPRSEVPSFRTDVERIAARFAVRADVIAEAVRRSDVLARLRDIEASAHGHLMAARDRGDDQARSVPTDGQK